TLTLLYNKVNAQQKVATKEVPITDKIIIVQCFDTKRKPFKPDEIQLLTNTIHGNVKDENGNALPLTTVSTIDNLTQTMTDEEGYFSLKLINPQADTKLLISNVGYEQKEIPIDLKDSMNIVLNEKQTVLPEVCVKSNES